LSHAALISSGITNGGCSQPSALRVAATSSAPSAAPCVAAVPCLFGAPQPIVVLQQINVGRSRSARAASIAALIASASCPSTFSMTCQPYARKRAGVSSVNQPSVGPSIEMPVSSQNVICLPSPTAPASEQASCDTPSIRQPSPANTHV